MLIKTLRNKHVTVYTKDNVQIEGDVVMVDKKSNLSMKNIVINGRDTIEKFVVDGGSILYVIY